MKIFLIISFIFCIFNSVNSKDKVGWIVAALFALSLALS